jgi:hypothetical protein
MSVVSVVCCQVEVSASGSSLVQRSPTDCGASNECDVETSRMRRPWPAFGHSATGKKISEFTDDFIIPMLKKRLVTKLLLLLWLLLVLVLLLVIIINHLFKLLKTDIHLNCSQNFISYLFENTVHLDYRDQSVNALYGNNRYLLRESGETHKYIAW